MSLRPITAARRAFFRSQAGTLMVDIEDPRRPVSQAFFWSWDGDFLIDRGEVLVPARRFGIFQLDLDASNLLGPAE
jgi:hypothetical protein